MAESKPTGKVVQPIIIVKKIRKGGHAAHHGGAWKLAYADFVTAMMAFFLLMWLLSYADPGTKEGIAQYFNRPLKSLLQSGPGSAPTSAPTPPPKVVQKITKSESQKLQDLKSHLESVIEHNPHLRAYKNQIKVDITTEGMRVQILDIKNRPMFAVGSAALEPYTKEILDQVGSTLNEVNNPISVAGHTDALQYAGGDRGYSNWELSSDRANAARRELIVGGMHANKVMQVRGLAGSVPLFKDLSNPSNRRISIVVLNAETVARLKADGSDAGTPGTPTAMPSPLGSPAPSGSPAPQFKADAQPADKAPTKP
jgi:chemotaxis protein MotB